MRFRFGVFALGLLIMPALANSQARTLSPALQPFISCRVSGGPDIVSVTPLVRGNSTRTVQTLHGTATVPLTDGARLTLAYPTRETFGWMRVEELPFTSFAQSKADLISNFKRLISGDELAFPNDALPPTMQGFEVYGQDHKELQGSVLGLYLLIENRTRVVTTVYFVHNDESPQPNFVSIKEYEKARDTFLAGYTACVRAKLVPAVR